MSPTTPRRASRRRLSKRTFSSAFPGGSSSDGNAEDVAALAAAEKRTETPTTAGARRTSAAGASAATIIDDNNDEIAMEALSYVAVYADADASEDEFWIAQLLDDVTHDMLESGDTAVRVAWLNKADGASNTGANDNEDAGDDGDSADGDEDDDSQSEKKKAESSKKMNQYEYAYDDALDVSTILCHVFALDCADGSLEITTRSLERIQRRLARAKATLTNPEASDLDDDDESDVEKPPSAARQRKQLTASVDRESDSKPPSKRSRTSSNGGGRGGGAGSRARKAAAPPKPKKLSKREAAPIIPPCYATVDIGMHEDREIYGTHEFTPFKDDVIAANKEVIRAVLTKDYALLEKVTETPEIMAKMSSFHTNRSVDIKMTALKYAVQADDVKAVAQLQKANAAVALSAFTSAPSSSLPQHSTGAHTSSYSNHSGRAIKASRGGKEGNNALLADANDDGNDEENAFLWSNSSFSLKMLTLFYPSGGWVDDNHVAQHVAAVARTGNITLLFKMVETLQRNDGWGFNDLHLRVLSSSNNTLPTFRNVSAVKMAYQSKIQPLHFAAINPNGKYLEQLWGTLVEKPEQSKDAGGFEPLHYAAVSESSVNVKFLIENHRSLLAKTKKDKLTPLMCAIRTNREENAIVMLDMAAERSSELLAQVINAKGVGSFQAIHFAAQHGCLHVIERLLHHGALINALAGGKTSALCVAAKFGQFEAARTLLSRGAKVDLPDKLGKTPLIFAVKNGHTRLAGLLINNGANLNAYDTSENSVAHYAASYGWLSCVELLASAGAEFWSRNAWGFVPLICALFKQRSQCADFILENDAHGRFLDFRDREGCTMLFLQCKHSRNLAQIEYLLEKGLNPNIPNAAGMYPLDVLIQRRGDDDFCLSAVELLLKNGALAQYETPVNTSRVSQPLHCAIQRNLVKITELLLTMGKADPAVTDFDGADAWLRAASMGDTREPFLRLLLTHHNEKFGGDKSPIPFARFSSGKNFFQTIVESNFYSGPTEILPVEIIQECLSRCPNVHELMHAKYNGLSPLMTLVSKECKWFNVVSAEPEMLEITKRSNKVYSDVVRLFAKYTTDPEALVLYKTVLNPLFKEKVPVPGTVVASAGDVDVESGEDDGDAEPRFFTVKAKNILHVVCERSFVTTLHSGSQQWYGDDILSIILEAFAFTQEEINFAETDGHVTPLLQAVKSRYLHGVTLLLANGANPDHSPIHCNQCSTTEKPVSISHCGLHHTLNHTALIDAINNDMEITKLLLANKANPECFNGDEMLTPLHIAMTNGNVEMTECLLKYGADPAKKDREGNTPLLRTIKANRSILVKKPHEGEVDYTNKSTVLSVANPNGSVVGSGEASIVEVALKYDNVKETLRMGDEHERTALYFAAKNRDVPLLQVLVNAHPDKETCANVCDIFGRTPLHAAVNAASMKADATFDVERFLLLAGADVNALDGFKFSALHFALFKVDLDWHATYDARYSHHEIAEQKRIGTYESIKEAASKEFFGKIPASESDPVETVSNLVAARGVNLQFQDLLDRTPIHLAAATGAFVCASTLLSNLPTGQSRQLALEMKDANEFTPLASAFLHLRQTTITTLIQSNASVSDMLRLSKNSETSSSKSAKARSFFYHAVKHSLAGIYHLLLNAKFSRRQAVEDAVLCGEFQLASNLIVGLEISNDSHLLRKCNDELSETLMHCIARVKKPFDDLPRSVAWTLVENGVDLSHVNLKGNTAFHYAAQNGNAHLMDFLLHHKCDINQKNFAGETPLMFALRREQQDVEKWMGLVDYFLNVPSFDLHAKDPSGRNVLLLVLDLFISRFQRADSALFKTVEALLKSGSKPDLLFQSEKHDWSEVYGLVSPVGDDATDAAAPPSETTSALMLITYFAPLTMRYELLNLFLKHNAKLTTTDANGNSVLMHLVAKNMKTEIKLALGGDKALNQRLQKKEIKAAATQQNNLGQTPLHIAVQALEYGAFENHDVVELLVTCGADFKAVNHAQKSVLDCIKSQNSRALFRFVHEKYPHIVSESEAEFFGDAVVTDAIMTDAPPDFAQDAATYLEISDAAGKLKKTLITPIVHSRCDVGNVSSVYCAKDDATDELIPGEYFNVLLTKVDVKNGRFGVNAFYRMQIVHDELQEIYILFTNWGRIGETGKYQNTPFRTAADAVVEFKKVFRSKTGNVWGDRRDAFEKKTGKYNLVQRVDFRTMISPEITEPFNARVKLANGAEPADFAPFTEQQPRNLTQMMYAITDIRNLQLAAATSCNYYGELPLAKKDELDAAIAKLQEILVVLAERTEVDAEIQILTGNITDEAATQLQLLSTKYEDLTESISEKSSQYYEVMPCDERSLGSPIKAFENLTQVNKELARLKLLSEITQTYKILLGAKLRQQEIHPLEYCRAALQVNLSPLDDSSQEKALLTKFFFQGVHKQNHKSYQISNIFRVDRHGEKERFTSLLESSPSLQKKLTHLLWHGTKRTNLMGILAQGLRIAPPEASHQGYQYGKGLYFGDVAQKSLDYCDSSYVIEEKGINEDGEKIIKKRHVQYMLLCEVALGEQTVAESSTHDAAIPEGTDSVKALGSRAPDMAKSVISPDCGAVVPLGPAGEPGVAYPISQAWAIGECPTYSNLNDTLNVEASQYLDTLIKAAKEGDEIVVAESEKKHFVNQWYRSHLKLTIHVAKRSETTVIERGVDVSLRCTIEQTHYMKTEIHVFHMHRYRNVFFESLIESGFRIEKLHRPHHYNEHVVYKEAQSRIRYLVEVQLVNAHTW